MARNGPRSVYRAPYRAARRRVASQFPNRACGEGSASRTAPRESASSSAGMTASTISGTSLPLEGGARRGEAREGHAERAARDVIQAHVLEELDGARVASMLAAHAHLEPRLLLPPRERGAPHQGADTRDVDRDEGIVLEDARAYVLRQEPPRIVPRIPERHLREIVRSEGEEVRVLRDLPG